MEDRDIEFSVVSGSNEEMLFGCLDSLHKTLKNSLYTWSVTVTCNEPGTGLTGRVRARYPDATVMQNERPLNLASNHNRVLKSSHARYVWLVNDDVVILPNTVQAVTEFMDRPGSSRVGVVSPKLLNPDGSLQPSTDSFPSMSKILVGHSGLLEFPLTERVVEFAAPGLRSSGVPANTSAGDGTLEVDTLRAACVAIRMKAARQVKPMAEVSAAGGEEAEWHRRFKDQGWKVVYFTDASVIHYGSQTVRDGSRSMHPEYLKRALFFFRTGRSTATYGLFCTTLLGMVGVRAAVAWTARDKAGLSVARRYAGVAWRGMRRD